MEVDFTPEQEMLVRQAIESGRLGSPEDAIREAILLWSERERRRSDILAVIDKSEASLAQGRSRRLSTAEDLKKLVGDVKRRGMARLATE